MAKLYIFFANSCEKMIFLLVKAWLSPYNAHIMANAKPFVNRNLMRIFYEQVRIS